ncbi:MAG: pyridoxal phosphate-dependent aminotransferase [Kiloniellaceae bacterium]
MSDASSLPPLNPAAAGLAPSKIVEVWQLGFEVDNLIALFVGEGDEPTPDFISAAATRALREGRTFYTPKRGIPPLRQALADYLQRHFGAAVDAGRITVTSSGMNAIMLTLQAVLAPGTTLVAPTPVWPNVLSAAEVAGGRVKTVPMTVLPEGGFKLDLERLFDACDETARALFIVSPSNPTGWVISRAEQEAVLDFCRRRGLWLIADEVYHRFVFDPARFPTGVAPSFLEIAAPDDALVVVNSFSKAWCMTGWRQGWLVHPPALGDVLGNLIEYNTSGGQSFLQAGCLAALTEGEPFVEGLVARCGQAAEMVFQQLASLPRVSLARPVASFYAFFRVEGVDDSLAFAKRILAETGVGLAPGSAFGAGGEGHLRLCFAGSPAHLAAGLDRLRPVLS